MSHEIIEHWVHKNQSEVVWTQHQHHQIPPLQCVPCQHKNLMSPDRSRTQVRLGVKAGAKTGAITGAGTDSGAGAGAR